MTSINTSNSLKDYQNFVREVYNESNQKHFLLTDMLTNVERFLARGLKGIRKKDNNKAKANFLISMSWFMSLMNQLNIDIESAVWQRFPNICLYCGNSPCKCKIQKNSERIKFTPKKSEKPKTIQEFQKMFERIYPPQSRTLEHAGIHLAEEMGELSEAILKFRGSHEEKDFTEISNEAADLFSCFIGILNSMKVDLAKEFEETLYEGCHVCHEAPCACNYNFTMNYKS